MVPDRLTGLRSQWGISGQVLSGTLGNPSGPVTAMDATAQCASRFAITTSIPPGQYLSPARLTITSAVESGIWQRTFEIFSYGICVGVPEGRVTASLQGFGASFGFRSTFGEGVVSREYQTIPTGVMTPGSKLSFRAPPYSRRIRVSAILGGPFNLTLTGLSGLVSGVVSILPAPGGQTAFDGWAPELITVENTGLTPGIASLEWEVLA